MGKKIDLVVFDYDGTITADNETVIRPSILTGVQALWQRGVKTTAITARPYHRLDFLSGGVHTFVSTDMPIATDRGARIVGEDRVTNLIYHPLQDKEVKSILAIPHNVIDFIGFYSEELRDPSYIWTPKKEKADIIRNRIKDNLIVLAESSSLLLQALKAANPCLVTIRFNSSNPINVSHMPDSLNLEWTGKSVSIITEGIDKQTALNFICNRAKFQVRNTLYAGNDFNDLPVFAIKDLHQRLFVGNIPLEGVEDCIKIASSDELGLYFDKLAKELQ